jgi:hypothetical protein
VSADPDDKLIEELRSVLRRTDPVPGDVTDFAKAAFGWRRLDADLAELLEDSALESESAALARGSGGRSLTFRSDDLTIDIEVEADTLLGQLAPVPNSATIELQDTNRTVVTTTESDTLGRFRLTLQVDGRLRLRVLRPDAQPLETSWFTV